MKRNHLFSLPTLAAVVALIGLSGCGGGAPTQEFALSTDGITRGSTDPQSLLGNPDNALTDANNHSKFFSKKTQFHLSYNDNQHIPNWVSWHIDSADLGSTSRTDAFAPDTSLPSTFTPISTSDYTGSGYDRGHQCPSADRTDTTANNKATFLMSNMIPQQHGLNAGPWSGLEDEARAQVAAGNECYIIAGPGFNSSTHNTIGAKKIHVPSWCWKLLVVLPKASGNDLNRINVNTRVIAVKMPNISTVSGQPWRKYRVSPATIEAATGLQFFTALPSATAAALRTKIDNG